MSPFVITQRLIDKLGNFLILPEHNFPFNFRGSSFDGHIYTWAKATGYELPSLSPMKWMTISTSYSSISSWLGPLLPM